MADGSPCARPAAASPSSCSSGRSQAVDDGGLVFGATTREDVYLLGGPSAWGDFVQALPWGEPELAPAIRSRLRDLGAGWAELPRLIEVADEDDLRAAGLLT